MNGKTAGALLAILIPLGPFGCGDSDLPPDKGPVTTNTPSAPTSEEPDRKLMERLAHIESLMPDQAAAMSQLGYHFSNLWFAINEENWPLADFCLAECRSNLRWAVRIQPVRKNSKDQDVSIVAIAEAIEAGQFTTLHHFIQSRDKAASVDAYHDTMKICHACHTASEKPFLRIQIPTAPAAPIIQFQREAQSRGQP